MISAASLRVLRQVCHQYKTFVTMGCSHSTKNEEFSVTELLIAKRPRGSDVGPVRISERITQRASEMEEGSVSDMTKLPIGTIIFSVVKVVPDINGVMYYYFRGSSAEEPTNQLYIAKRYTEFKALHTEISKLMANERIVPVAQQHLFETQPALPEMPKAHVWMYLSGRFNDQILEKREEQFTRILNAITKHPVAFRSTSFTSFVNQARALRCKNQVGE